jgi:hypothetical protein
LLLEGKKNSCDCSAVGRDPVTAEHQPAIDAALADVVGGAAGLGCFCEIEQVSGSDLEACKTSLDEPVVNASGQAVDGWCYIDATTVPVTGNPELVKDCPITEQRKIRFVGEGNPETGAMLFIFCAGE